MCFCRLIFPFYHAIYLDDLVIRKEISKIVILSYRLINFLYQNQKGYVSDKLVVEEF